ncbi:hypothetical protein QUF96_03090 [Bacillus bombysepticus]|nr:hypothetical protein [Bacillus bombysepticus]
MKLKVNDKVTIVDENEKKLAEGVIYNINDFREPSMKYAVDVRCVIFRRIAIGTN